MGKNINAFKLVNISLLATIVILVGTMEFIAYKKKTVDDRILQIVKESKNIEEVSEKLVSKGYTTYVDGPKLMVKIYGVWNSLYYADYLEEAKEETSGETMYTK